MSGRRALGVAQARREARVDRRRLLARSADNHCGLVSAVTKLDCIYITTVVEL
jgi:hypothetical protein